MCDVVVVGADDVVEGARGVVSTGGALVTVGVGVTGSGDGALGAGVGTVPAGAGCARGRGFFGLLAARWWGAGGGAAVFGVLTGARPEVTESGDPARPTLVDASWLADHATVAVATMPSSAAATHNSVRRFTIKSTYSGWG